jgi:hypothetical protein
MMYIVVPFSVRGGLGSRSGHGRDLDVLGAGAAIGEWRLGHADAERGGADGGGEGVRGLDQVAVEFPGLFPVAADLDVPGLEGFHHWRGGPVPDQ